MVDLLEFTSCTHFDVVTSFLLNPKCIGKLYDMLLTICTMNKLKIMTALKPNIIQLHCSLPVSWIPGGPMLTWECLKYVPC